MWEINVGNQFATFLYSLALGAILCLYYDLIRSLRKSGFNSFAAVFFTDIIFWVSSAFTVFIFLISRTNGEIRGYVLAGVLLGFILFRLAFSKPVFIGLTFIFKIIARLRAYVVRFFDTAYRKIEAIISKMRLWIAKILKSSAKSVKKLLKNRLKLLYTDKNNADAEYVLNETKT